MKFYKVVKYCKLCNTRFFVHEQKGAAQYYCESCFKKYKKPTIEKK